MFQDITGYLNYWRKRSAVERVLSENRFEHASIGPINKIRRVSKFVISMPKCGTTSIQRGFENIGYHVIHAHNDPTTYEALANGNQLRASGVGLATLVRFRRHLNGQPIHLFLGYREPISWYLSLAGHFRLPLNGDLKAKIVSNLRSASPWNRYQFAETQQIVESATGTKLFQRDFDYRNGYSVTRKSHVSVVVYRFDKMLNLESYIKDQVDHKFELGFRRVNLKDEYVNFVKGFRLPAATIRELYSDSVFSYFYDEEDAARLTEKYMETE